NYNGKLFYLIIPLILVIGCGESSFDQGDRLYSEEKYEEAVEAFNTFLQTNPKNVRALYNRARAYEELGDLENAEKDFKRALLLDDKNGQILLSLSNLYQNMGAYEAA